MGLYAEIYRGTYDYELNAFYGADRIWIANADGPFEFREGDKAGLIVRGYYGGSAKVVPAALKDGQWVADDRGMFGGTYCDASDSRFGDAVEEVAGYRWLGALHIHDRLEDSKW